MIEQNLFGDRSTTLDLNGPILSFLTQPVGVATTSTGSVTLTGIATATFPTTATNTGIVTYQWYEVDVGALSDDTYITGTATTTLTVSNLITPYDNNRQFYLTADYIPSAYNTTGITTVGTARSTGNAINDPITSNTATVTVYPLLEIVAQPSSITAAINSSATFSVNSGLTDNSFVNDLVYQWYYNGSPLTDGTITDSISTTTTTTTTTYVTQNQTSYRDVTTTKDRSDTITFTSPGSITLHPTSNNVKVRVAGARGGNGGSDAGSSGGSGSGGRFGEFSYSSGGRTLTFTVGKRGNDGASNANGGGGGSGGDGLNRGGDGGNAGSSGASGGGGGGGGSTGVYDNTYGYHTIIASGGGGGGGASYQVSGAPANPTAGGFSPDGRNRSDGNPGEPAGGNDGGGGGGGGAGTDNSPSPDGVAKRKQLGGRSGRDIDKGNVQAYGGGNGRQIDEGSGYGAPGAVSFGGFDRGAASFGFNGSQNDGDGYGQVSYNWTETTTTREPYTESVQVAVPTTTTTTTSSPRNIKFSGSKAPSLTIVADNIVGLATIFCKITSALATNSPVSTDIVEYKVVSSAENYFINLEQIGSTSTASLTTINLVNGEYTINRQLASTNIENIVLYAPDRDINIEMDLYGGKGNDVGSYKGGEGGFSRIRFTMSKNTEYVIAGLTEAINTPFLYKKSQLISCVGGGGNAGTFGNGGFGGGVGVGGQNGTGRGSGTGGNVYSGGSLPTNGIFGSLTTLTAISPDTKASIPNAGKVLPCAKGIYWKNQGYTACADVGTTQFRLSDGTIVTNTGSITRGFKSGYDITQTAGAGSNGGGNGGSGATGGNGGLGAGGGGGSGYTDGSVTVVSSILGGSTGNAKVILRVVT